MGKATGLEEARLLIPGARSALIMGHQYPDGDAIGSVLGLGLMLAAAGYDVQASFTTASAWSTFRMRNVGGYSGFAGAAFDGRYLYVVSTGYGPMLRFAARTPPALPPGHNASFY